MIKAVARAFRWLRMLETGRFATITELAAAEKINASYVSRILRLALLAPDVVEAILDGRQGEGVTLPGLLAGVEVEWGDQGGCRLAASGDRGTASANSSDSECQPSLVVTWRSVRRTQIWQNPAGGSLHRR